ncbi:MAG: hypothetical protein ACM3JC_04955 [Rudaea sp.]
MKRILVGTALVLFGFAPGIGLADCGADHAAMASATPPPKAQVAKTQATSKAPATVAKASQTKAAKQSGDKSLAKADGSAVVAKSN